MERIIGKYTGSKKGPLLICLAGMHGNELAGVKALRFIFRALELEPLVNPSFHFKGRMLGLLGNVPALEKEVRFIEKDLNRQWAKENVSRIKNANKENLQAESLEVRELLEVILEEIKDYRPEKIFILDLHTTGAFGGIFSVSSEDPESVNIAVELHAPVIRGMLEGIKGTTLHYFSKEEFRRHIVGVAFESGQHDDPLSVNRAIAAIINCMRSVECVRTEDVENRYDALLIKYSKDLPKIASLISRHEIRPGDQFRMVPGFKNFEAVRKGQLLAHDVNGPIYASEDGLLLMPLYQKQGEDGFFLIRPEVY